MDIKVLGPGCAKCAEVQKIMQAVVDEVGTSATIEKITDFQQIAKYGVFSTPAVVIDGQVKCVDRVPTRKDVLARIG